MTAVRVNESSGSKGSMQVADGFGGYLSGSLTAGPNITISNNGTGSFTLSASLSAGSQIGEAEDEDYIFYSDNDEIPNFDNINLKANKNKILIFKQKLFYYKFNLFFDKLDWFGTKACKKKDLISLSWLRDIKSKKYPQYRLDTIFSKTKYRDVRIVDDGGWHFSQVKTPKDIETKLLNGEQHAEFKKTGRDLNYIEDLVKRKIIDYDHDADSKSYKYSKEFKLRSVSINSLPPYLRQNVNKYSEWFDFNN